MCLGVPSGGISQRQGPEPGLAVGDAARNVEKDDWTAIREAGQSVVIAIVLALGASGVFGGGARVLAPVDLGRRGIV